MRARLWLEGDGGEEEEGEDVEEGKPGGTKAEVVVEVVVVAVHVACSLRLGGWTGRNPLESSRRRFLAIFEYVADHDDEDTKKMFLFPQID